MVFLASILSPFISLLCLECQEMIPQGAAVARYPIFMLAAFILRVCSRICYIQVGCFVGGGGGDAILLLLSHHLSIPACSQNIKIFMGTAVVPKQRTFDATE